MNAEYLCRLTIYAGLEINVIKDLPDRLEREACSKYADQRFGVGVCMC